METDSECLRTRKPDTQKNACFDAKVGRMLNRHSGVGAGHARGHIRWRNYMKWLNLGETYPIVVRVAVALSADNLQRIGNVRRTPPMRRRPERCQKQGVAPAMRNHKELQTVSVDDASPESAARSSSRNHPQLGQGTSLAAGVDQKLVVPSFVRAGLAPREDRRIGRWCWERVPLQCRRHLHCNSTLPVSTPKNLAPDPERNQRPKG